MFLSADRYNEHTSHRLGGHTLLGRLPVGGRGYARTADTNGRWEVLARLRNRIAPRPGIGVNNGHSGNRINV